jgi:hypothetical protein
MSPAPQEAEDLINPGSVWGKKTRKHFGFFLSFFRKKNGAKMIKNARIWPNTRFNPYLPTPLRSCILYAEGPRDHTNFTCLSSKNKGGGAN